jgi:hypothetical protein
MRHCVSAILVRLWTSQQFLVLAWFLRSSLKVLVQVLLLQVLRRLLLQRLLLHGQRFLRCKIRWELHDGRGRGRRERPRNSLGRLFQEFGEREQRLRRQLFRL